ncbi:MAG: mechanosensitive ion channel family protein [Chloroflexi bacterium]|nr:mechanosensitive ion channel family protein [Chloroflexota bacterium]
MTFKEPLFNYSFHLHYIWDEITVPITYDSDWQRAIAIMLSAVQESAHYQNLLPSGRTTSPGPAQTGGQDYTIGTARVCPVDGQLD